MQDFELDETATKCSEIILMQLLLYSEGKYPLVLLTDYDVHVHSEALIYIKQVY